VHVKVSRARRATEPGLFEQLVDRTAWCNAFLGGSWLAARAGATRDAAWARSSAEARRAREKQKAGRQDSGEEQPVAEDPETEDQDAAYQRWESEERNRAVQQWPGWWVKGSSVDAAEGDSAAQISGQTAVLESGLYCV
jgi:hypothetical protein